MGIYKNVYLSVRKKFSWIRVEDITNRAGLQDLFQNFSRVSLPCRKVHIFGSLKSISDTIAYNKLRFYGLFCQIQFIWADDAKKHKLL